MKPVGHVQILIFFLSFELRRPRGNKCHDKICGKGNEGKKINTQHVPLRQIAEGKVRGKGQEEVWIGENG